MIDKRKLKYSRLKDISAVYLLEIGIAENLRIYRRAHGDGRHKRHCLVRHRIRHY